MSVQNKSFEWNSGRVDPGEVRWLHYRCPECGHRLAVSPRAKTRIIPSMYCGECENGPPMQKYKVEFSDGTEATKGNFEGSK